MDSSYQIENNILDSHAEEELGKIGETWRQNCQYISWSVS